MTTPFDQAYLTLTLEIEKHFPGYIDAYLGPPTLKAQVNAAPKRPPAALLDDCAALQVDMPTADATRHAYLTAMLRAVETTLRLLNGESFGYLEEVARLYDIQPALTDEALFTAAHGELDALLPGGGSLAERMEARRKRYELQSAQVLPLLERAREACRHRTRRIVDLPADEDIEIRLVSQQPWSAYNWFLGHGRSLIEFNTDVPISALGLLGTFAHEGYPGHHTEGTLKEMALWRARGYGEQASFLLHSPAAVIAEGIATTALEIIFPDETDLAWTVENLLRPAGISPEPITQMQRIAHAGRALRGVSANAAILYHTDQINRDQALDYLITYGLSSPERAAKRFEFFTNPLFRSYIFTYTHGYDLIAAAADGDKAPLFRRLLTEQILPSQLAEISAH